MKSQSSIHMNFFTRVPFLRFFWKNRKSKNAKGSAPALQVLAREPGWRFTARCHTKTVAKRKSREPRTQMHLTMKLMFLSVNASQSMPWSLGRSLSYVLRLRMEIVRPKNTRAISEFYPVEIFHEGAIFETLFLKKSKKLKKWILMLLAEFPGAQMSSRR